MNHKVRIALSAICAIGMLAALAPQLSYAGRRLTPELLWKLGRVGEVAISPDGKQVAYIVTNYDLGENSGTSDLIIQAIAPLQSNPHL